MAQQLTPDETPRPRARGIDWSRFCDGSWWGLAQGEDFEQEPLKAANAFRQFCARRGWIANATVTEDGIRIRARKEEAVR